MEKLKQEASFHQKQAEDLKREAEKLKEEAEKLKREASFYYKDERGNEIGPIFAKQLRTLRKQGEIADDTLVRRGNLQVWRPLSKALSWNQSYKAEELFQKNFNAVPLLYGNTGRGSAHGSGFVVSTHRKNGLRWFIVTNRHVVEGLQKLEGKGIGQLPFEPRWSVLVFRDDRGEIISAIRNDSLQVVAVHKRADIALIECTQASKSLKEWRVCPLRLAPRDIESKPGTEVVVIGHPGNPGAGGDPEPMTFTKGQIAGPEREIEGCRFYQLQVPLAPGNSGGPVLDMTGQVVGVVTLGALRLNQGQFNYALHIKYLHELLDEIP